MSPHVGYQPTDRRILACGRDDIRIDHARDQDDERDAFAAAAERCAMAIST